MTYQYRTIANIIKIRFHRYYKTWRVKCQSVFLHVEMISSQTQIIKQVQTADVRLVSKYQVIYLSSSGFYTTFILNNGI